jgi:rfaE bifunctional protein nucleotidyltransferase chain/domain/rfaE bifunctional protein kinase chain/domain
MKIDSPGTPLVVVGDAMLDVDVIATARRLSPEAPVPVLDQAREFRRPGGAALAAALAAGGGRPVVLIAPLADDQPAAELRSVLPEEVELIALGCTGATAVKTRFRAGEHPVVRVDAGADRVTLGELPATVERTLAGAAAVLVADYGRGCTADPRLRRLLAGAAAGRPLIWDPHPHGEIPVPGTLVATPNEAELLARTGCNAAGLAGLSAAAARLLTRWQLPWLAVTLGERGAMLFDGNTPRLIGGVPVTGQDTCGAGDCLAAALAAALADGALPSEAAEIAVRAAGEFVRAGAAAAFATGTGQLAGAPAPAVVGTAALTRVRGGTVVATGGCFDLIHPGHVAVLEAARRLGDCLIVCLNSDESVRRLKGAGRPLQSEQDRATVLRALRCVDEVLVFDEDTPAELLRKLRPDVWVKGGDYAGIELPEAAVLAEWGGIAVTVPYQPGRSTSNLVQLAESARSGRDG